MKSIHFLAALSLSISGLAFAAGGHDHGSDHKPVHGGIVVEANHMDFELVATPNVINLHLRDHGKPMDVSKATAKVTLLAGSQKQEIELKPDGDKLVANGAFKTEAGAKAIAQVSVNGKTSTARFVLK